MLVDISERKQAETQQRILLNELNHRVKNNMQMLQSLLSASARQSRQQRGQRRMLEDAEGRIAAMAAAQRVLYERRRVRFNAEQFLRSVCQPRGRRFLRSIGDRLQGRRKQARQRHRHAARADRQRTADQRGQVRTGGKDGTIRVALTRKGDGYSLSVEDDGPGFDLEEAKKRWSGLSLIQGLARQLGGQFLTSRSPTRCSVEFGRGPCRGSPTRNRS